MFDVKGWLDYLIDSFINIIKVIFEGLWFLFNDFLLFVAQSVLMIGDWALALIFDQLPPFDASSMWGQIGGDTIGLLGYVGFFTALEMIIAAMAVRLVLNFIPFIG